MRSRRPASPWTWDHQGMGAGVFARTGDPLPAATLASIRSTGVALKGPVETPVTSGMRSVNLALRRELELFACVRPCRLYPGVPAYYDAVDLIVVRENIEDMYTGIEFEEGTAATTELIGFVAETSGRRCAPTPASPSRRSRSSGANASCGSRSTWRSSGGDRRHGRSQGEHHEVHRWAVPGGRPARGRRVPGGRVRGSDHRRALHAADPGARTLRRPGACRTSTATSCPTWRRA